MIREAIPEDTERLFELLRQVNQVHADGRPDLFVSGGRKYTEDQLLALMRDEARPLFVFTDDSGVVLGHAFCILQQEPATTNRPAMKTLYIDDICVDEAYRGRGIASALYRHVRDYAKSLGCYHVTLNVWELNGPAKAFYQAMGLVPMKTTLEQIL